MNNLFFYYFIKEWRMHHHFNVLDQSTIAYITKCHKRHNMELIWKELIILLIVNLIVIHLLIFTWIFYINVKGLLGNIKNHYQHQKFLMRINIYWIRLFKIKIVIIWFVHKHIILICMRKGIEKLRKLLNKILKWLNVLQINLLFWEKLWIQVNLCNQIKIEVCKKNLFMLDGIIHH